MTIKANPAKGPCFNFGSFVSSELNYRWRDQGSAFKYSAEGPKYKWYDALGIKVVFYDGVTKTCKDGAGLREIIGDISQVKYISINSRRVGMITLMYLLSGGGYY